MGVSDDSIRVCCDSPPISIRDTGHFQLDAMFGVHVRGTQDLVKDAVGDADTAQHGAIVMKTTTSRQITCKEMQREWKKYIGNKSYDWYDEQIF